MEIFWENIFMGYGSIAVPTNGLVQILAPNGWGTRNVKNAVKPVREAHISVRCEDKHQIIVAALKSSGLFEE